ncbi:MAG TPA: ribose-5-phosphate isomerase [Dermatophilaceae bacterium]|jgi:ribose 5-phosphate isomerase B|nr:ribose-5-phosphate isomerase [Dermatophilaceae bacterium]
MRVHLGGDHAAYDLKCTLLTFLQAKGYDVVDHGPYYCDPEDDYPVAVLRAAEAVSGDVGAFGIVLGGSGNGEQMAANKVRGIRAALAYNVEVARLARTHNNAQVLSIGSRMNTVDEAEAMVETFLTTKFSGDERHARRLAMVERYEHDGQLPPIPAAEG